MSTPQTGPKRPRLSLQIKNAAASSSRTTRTMALVDPKSPTAFNTLSNVYVTAIERSTPVQPEPLTAINTQQPIPAQTANEGKEHRQRIQTPYAASYPETPLTANPLSPGVTMEITFPSAMTATPPLSAGPVEANAPRMFSFPTAEPNRLTISTNVAPVMEMRTPRRRATFASHMLGELPYTHPRSLHSILRNSPLPPSSAKTPMSPRRQSLRLQEKAARRVAYNSPLTQTITTSRYTKSHIDLLLDDPSPLSPAVGGDPDTVLDMALAFTADETRDGGQTPGPFEEMRRRMASLGTTTPVSPAGPGGIRKRKKKEKKRRWVWTIGQEEEQDEEVSGAIAAIRAAEAAAVKAAEDRTPMPQSREAHMFVELPTPSIERPESELESMDVEMSDTASFVSDDRALTPGDFDMDLRTPIAPPRNPNRESQSAVRNDRLSSVPLLSSETEVRRDTPVPPDLLVA